MRAKRINRDEQVKLIMECRRSGLSDYQWCEANGVLPGTFYNWISRLRKEGYAIPDPAPQPTVPAVQEVVKLPVSNSANPANAIGFEEQNTSNLSLPGCQAAVEIELGKTIIRLYNGADPRVVQTVLQLMGGAVHAR